MKRVPVYLLFVLTWGLNPIGLSRAYATNSGSPKVSAENYCAAEKIEASGEYMQAMLECAGQARGQGKAAGHYCQSQALRKLTQRYTALERGGACKTTGDSAEVADRIDAHADELVATLLEPIPSHCAKYKLAVMGKDAERHHACYADAVEKGAGYSVDPACQDKATRQFLAAFARTGNMRGCVAGTADGLTLDASIQETVRGSRAVVAPPISTCAPIEVTTLHGTSFLPNGRVSKIENGQVPCMHTEEGTIATCVFSTASGRESGEWLESPTGNFALAGQALSLNGQPGGDYVVATRVSDAAPAPCIEPAGMDTAGRLEASSTLPSVCISETPLRDYNSLSALTGYTPIVNYADREVCSSNNPLSSPHPDGAQLVRSYAQSGSGPHDTFCYSSYGAALNDINGTERDETLAYITDENHCHMLVSGGVEVPAAKRPATRSLPLRVDARTRVLWRPVNPNIVIANGDIPNNPTPPRVFTSKVDFLNETIAASATGPLPDLGAVIGSVTIGTVTLSLAAGGNTLWVGSAGTSAEPDWMPLLPGNDIALGYENLQVQVATTAPVYALGFDFYEPNATMPPFGGTPVDSTFEGVMYSGAAEVGRFTFNAPDDEPAFIGVWSVRPFNRVTISDTTGNDDDEYFGQFYTGTNPR